jgi:uncharacterized protein (TIGR02594 family)
MKFRVKKTTALFEHPNGTRRRILSPNQVVTGTGRSDGDFIEVDAGDGKPAWVLKADCDPIGADERPPIDPGNFVASCITVERTINSQATTAPWFISADFLIARALIETGLQNAGPKFPNSDAVGPLQVGSSEWNRFQTGAGAIAAIFHPLDFDDWLMQINGAAYTMYIDAKAITKVQLAKGVGTEQEPFLPSLLDIFHAYLTKSPEAAVAILDAQNSDAGKSQRINAALLGPLTQAQIDALFNTRTPFMGTSDAPKSVGDFVAASEAALNDGLKRAFDLIKEHAPEELPQMSQGEAPWFDVALTAEKDKIDQNDPADKDIILDYFKVTNLGRPNEILPWCGAFAAHCMDASGNSIAVSSIPHGAAAAASWKTWGNEISLHSGDIPQGAVVVLSAAPEAQGTGHVGFFVRLIDNDHVELLGGNQSHKVQRTSFHTSRIASVRWLELDSATRAQAPIGPSSQTAISDEAISLIVEAEVSGPKTYEKVYRRPTWPKGASGVTIGIGYDVGYVTGLQLAEDWGPVMSASMIAQLQTACGVKGAAAGPLAKKLAENGVDVPFDDAMKVFLKRDIPRWVGIVERALRNTNALSKDCLGALVSLAYNRGASFSKAGDRYTEMRNIKTFMDQSQFDRIPDEFRKMKRLWPDMRGLQTRREAEAQLFERGLARPADV